MTPTTNGDLIAAMLETWLVWGALWVLGACWGRLWPLNPLRCWPWRNLIGWANAEAESFPGLLEMLVLALFGPIGWIICAGRVMGALRARDRRGEQ